MKIDQLTDPNEVEKLARRLGAAHISHELVMSDNIFDRLSYDHKPDTLCQYPVKVIGASIIFCVEGSISYRINLAEHIVNSGEALVVLPGSIMQITAADSSTRIATISFASEYHEAIVNVSPLMRESPVIRLPETDMEECLCIYRNLSQRLRQDATGAERSVAKGYIRVICSILFYHWQKLQEINTDIQKSRPSELYGRFLAKVQEDYRSHRAVKHYADSLCVTPKYLSATVKHESGRNASDFIDELVIFESKALLMDGRYTVQQVAEMMEFPNPSFFAKYFRLHCGISPSGYRKHSRFK